MKWDQLKWPEVKELSKNTVIVLPIAAVEQHGPHLPLGTDSFIAEGITAALDSACNGGIGVLPVQRIGCSDHHISFPGTLTLSHETFIASVMETLAAVVAHGFHRFLLLNSHGGNQAAGGVISEKASQRWPDVELVFTSWWRSAGGRLRGLVEGEYPSVGHACEFETSLMLVFQPGLVRMELAADDGIPQHAVQLQGDLLSAGSATLSRPFDKATRTGVFGRPTLASADKGASVLDVVVTSLRELIDSCWPDALPARTPD